MTYEQPDGRPIRRWIEAVTCVSDYGCDIGLALLILHLCGVEKADWPKLLALLSAATCCLWSRTNVILRRIKTGTFPNSIDVARKKVTPIALSMYTGIWALLCKSPWPLLPISCCLFALVACSEKVRLWVPLKRKESFVAVNALVCCLYAFVFLLPRLEDQLVSLFGFVLLAGGSGALAIVSLCTAPRDPESNSRTVTPLQSDAP